MKIETLLWSVMIIVIMSCSVTTDEVILGDESEYTDYMIQAYCDVDSMEIVQSINDNNSIRLRKETYTWLSHNEHESLTLKYHDYHWQRNVGIRTLYYYAYSNEFTGITVVSDADFNDIPAGQPLDSKVRIVALSPYRWLKSESVLTYDWSAAPPDYDLLNNWLYFRDHRFLPSEVFPVNKTLTDLVPEDMLLIFVESLYLHFTETPAIKEHNLKITFKDPRKDVVAEGPVKFK